MANASQAQPLNALVFLFAQVLKQPLGDIGPFRRANWSGFRRFYPI
jgi:hypothetical protein